MLLLDFLLSFVTTVEATQCFVLAFIGTKQREKTETALRRIHVALVLKTDIFRSRPVMDAKQPRFDRWTHPRRSAVRRAAWDAAARNMVVAITTARGWLLIGKSQHTPRNCCGGTTIDRRRSKTSHSFGGFRLILVVKDTLKFRSASFFFLRSLFIETTM